MYKRQLTFRRRRYLSGAVGDNTAALRNKEERIASLESRSPGVTGAALEYALTNARPSTAVAAEPAPSPGVPPAVGATGSDVEVTMQQGRRLKVNGAAVLVQSEVEDLVVAAIQEALTRVSTNL